MSIIRQYQINAVYYLIFFGGRIDYLRFIFKDFPFVSLGIQTTPRTCETNGGGACENFSAMKGMCSGTSTTSATVGRR